MHETQWDMINLSTDYRLDGPWLVSSSGVMTDLRKVTHVNHGLNGQACLFIGESSDPIEINLPIKQIGEVIRRISTVDDSWRNLYAIESNL